MTKMFLKKLSFLLVIIASISFVSSCGDDKKAADDSTSDTEEAPKSMIADDVDPMDNVGIGPVKELTLPAEIDEAMAEAGHKIFKEKCSACHKISKKFIGPSPKGIFERRNPAWVMNMILNPDVMILEDPIAIKLLAEFNGSPMANQNLSEEEARSVLEYFRTL